MHGTDYLCGKPCRFRVLAFGEARRGVPMHDAHPVGAFAEADRITNDRIICPGNEPGLFISLPACGPERRVFVAEFGVTLGKTPDARMALE